MNEAEQERANALHGAIFRASREVYDILYDAVRFRGLKASEPEQVKRIVDLINNHLGPYKIPEVHTRDDGGLILKWFDYDIAEIIAATYVEGFKFMYCRSKGCGDYIEGDDIEELLKLLPKKEAGSAKA